MAIEVIKAMSNKGIRNKNWVVQKICDSDGQYSLNDNKADESKIR